MGTLNKANLILIPTLNFAKNKVIRNAYVGNHRLNMMYPLFTKYVLGSSALTWESTPQNWCQTSLSLKVKEARPTFLCVSKKKCIYESSFLKSAREGQGRLYLAPPRSWTTETGVIHIPRRKKKAKNQNDECKTNAKAMQGLARYCAPNAPTMRFKNATNAFFSLLCSERFFTA